MPIGILLTRGHRHYAHRADVAWHLECDFLLFASLQIVGAEEAHHRLESVGQGIVCLSLLVVEFHGIAPPYAEDAVDTPRVGPYHLLEEIHSLNPQGTASVEVIPGFWGFEGRDVEQPLIDHS